MKRLSLSLPNVREAPPGWPFDCFNPLVVFVGRMGKRPSRLDHLERACDLEQIDALGLGPTEQQYLQILREGDSRLNVIASRIGLPSRTVSQVTEPFLIRVGLVCKDDQGRRQLTQKGREHLAKTRQNDV